MGASRAVLIPRTKPRTSSQHQHVPSNNNRGDSSKRRGKSGGGSGENECPSTPTGKQHQSLGTTHHATPALKERGQEKRQQQQQQQQQQPQQPRHPSSQAKATQQQRHSHNAPTAATTAPAAPAGDQLRVHAEMSRAQGTKAVRTAVQARGHIYGGGEGRGTHLCIFLLAFFLLSQHKTFLIPRP
jgi:hypothetical protein